MARTKDPAIRALLLERAAHMLRTREPITLRSLVAGTGVSTMAVYTWFGGMDGMWTALRQEGFTRLARRYDALEPTADPVRDLGVLVAAYVANALEHPDLYRVMFDTAAELQDLDAANDTLKHLVRAVHRGRDDSRFRADVVPRELGTLSWVVVHGMVSLVANGPLGRDVLTCAPDLLVALYVRAGDEPERCRASVGEGWSAVPLPD